MLTGQTNPKEPFGKTTKKYTFILTNAKKRWKDHLFFAFMDFRNEFLWEVQ